MVHPRDNDLVIGTHGRGIWIMDDITPLEEWSQEVLAAEAHLFSTQTATIFNPNSPQGWTPGSFVAPNPPFGALIRYYLKEDLKPMRPAMAMRGANGGGNGRRGPTARGDTPRRGQFRGQGFRGRRGRNGEKEPKATITILDASGEVVRELEGAGKAGVQQVVWDLRIEPPYVPEENQRGGGGGFFRRAPRGPTVLPGTYTVQLAAGGETFSTDVEVRGDPRIQIARADLEARQQTLMSAYTLSKTVYEARQAVRRLTEQITDVQDLLKAHEDAPENLTADADSLRNEIRRVGRDMNRANAGSRGSFSIEGSTTRPTADQLWQLEQAWEKVPPLVTQINEIIETKMPALYRQLDEHGIRPDPGEPLAMPTPPGN
ncbi:MAG: hypothetical protein IH820_00485 [Bacteroidetes bacterium]|nr:hypothetical protein [Bacteroidota bacterium]